MARKKFITKISQWVLVCEDDLRRHKSQDMTAKECAERNLSKLDPEIREEWTAHAPANRLAERLRSRRDEFGARLNGCFRMRDPESGESRWIWKPLDAMTAEQIRVAFEHMVRGVASDIRSLVATESLCNSLLAARGAHELNPRWRAVVEADLNGESGGAAGAA